MSAIDPECDENAFDGLHCPRWYHGGRCSYCGAPQPRSLTAAEELAAAKADPEGRELSPAAQALHEAEGAARFAAHHPAARFSRPYMPEFDPEPRHDR